MSSEHPIIDDIRFIETCVELKFINQTDADLLRGLTQSKPGQVAQEALGRGVLDAVEVDIVLSLGNPLEVVPGYELLGLVGRGGMGVVYRARQLDLDRTVALKTILISNVSDPTAAARFQREAKALARLQHPNIIQALNFGKHQGRYYFAMEFISGRTCEQAIRDQGFLPADDVWMIVRQVASGLLHAHRQNLIHRDIKPANLILVPPPEGTLMPSGETVKIADFGLAMFSDMRGDTIKLTTADKIIGSPAYMSPEQFSGDPVDFRTDIYALGATAWHLLFGRAPFDGTSVAALLAQKLKPLEVDPADLPVAISDSQWQLLMGMLDVDPGRRPPSYEALIDAIDALGTGRIATTSGDQRLGGRDSISQQPTVELDAASVAATGGQPAGSSGVEPAVTQSIRLGAGGSRRLWLLVAILGAVVIAVGLLAQLTPTRGPRTFTRVVQSRPLFDGLTLSGWDVGGSMVGAWNTVEAPDASTAIACTTARGALTRRLPDADNPRISLFVWLVADGTTVDIDFAVDPSQPDDVRGCLRLDESTVRLGSKSGDFGPLDISSELAAPMSMSERYHVVYLERQSDDWYVFVEEQLIGTLQIDRVGKGEAIRVAVQGPTSDELAPPHAFFADLRIDDLRPRQ